MTEWMKRNIEELAKARAEWKRLGEIRDSYEAEANEKSKTLTEAEYAKWWANEGFKKEDEVDEQMTELFDRLATLKLKCVKVGDGITLRTHTDQEAYTIIKRTEKTITIQRDKATIISGKGSNLAQEWIYERNPNGRILTLRWSDTWDNWRDEKTILGRDEFYDYEF